MHYTYAQRQGGVAPEFGSPGPEPAEITIRAHRLAELIHQLRPDIPQEGIAMTLAELTGAWQPYAGLPPTVGTFHDADWRE
jgi:hypothetical protein